MINHYDTLSVSQTAPIEVIRASYKALSQRHHPDKGGDPETMAAINEAWRWLGDVNRREAHDMQLSYRMPDIPPRPAKPEPTPPVVVVRRGAPFTVDDEIMKKAHPFSDVHRHASGPRQTGGGASIIARMFGIGG